MGSGAPAVGSTEPVDAPADGAPATAPRSPPAVAGSIDAAGQTTSTTLDLVAGQQLYAHGTTACGPHLQYRLLTPDGTQHGAAPDACGDLGRVEVDRTGAWSLVVESWGGGTGPYAVELTPIRADTAAPLPDGVAVTGEIVDRGEVHRFGFSGAAGELVTLLGAGTRRCLGVAQQLDRGVRTGRQRPAVRVSRHRPPRAPGTGDYELRVASCGGGAALRRDPRADPARPLEASPSAPRWPPRSSCPGRRSGTGSRSRPARRCTSSAPGRPRPGSRTPRGTGREPLGVSRSPGAARRRRAGDGDADARRRELRGWARRLHDHDRCRLTPAGGRSARSGRGEPLEVGDDEGDVAGPCWTDSVHCSIFPHGGRKTPPSCWYSQWPWP